MYLVRERERERGGLLGSGIAYVVKFVNQRKRKR